ncbi:hypothetical protein [Herbaspirillum rubrisubalbicans]|uniref:hypothetical protein n=1 Tax=Herbaspirillum rubrisubalbicans TaxID=80842 RepID=UPI0011BD7ECD|nr:hypothetical protein [Herbaspirillum rubrisubalbicans]
MNVSELIDMLKKCDPQQRVVVDGYEGGFDDVTDVRVQSILVEANKVGRPGLGTTHWTEIPHEHGSGAHAADDEKTPLSVRSTVACETAIRILSAHRS